MKIIDKVKQLLSRREMIFSFEFFPPKTVGGTENLYVRINRMSALEPTWIDVTWGAGGQTSERTLEIASNTQKYCGVDVMMHLTCTNLTRDEIRQVLVRAKEAGLQNILALRGDPVRGTTWKPCKNGFTGACELVKFIREEFGDYFCIGVGGYPEGWKGESTYENDLINLKNKIDAGADMVLTQLFYDAPAYGNFLKDCHEMGIEVPIVPGIMPIQSFKAFKSMTEYCKCTVPKAILDRLKPVKDDDAAVREVGIEIMINFCRECLNYGAPGLHFYTLNLERSVRQIISGLESHLSVFDPGKISRDPSCNNLQDLLIKSAVVNATTKRNEIETKDTPSNTPATPFSISSESLISTSQQVDSPKNELVDSSPAQSSSSSTLIPPAPQQSTEPISIVSSPSPTKDAYSDGGVSSSGSPSIAPILRLDSRNSQRRRLPWRPSTMANREKEDVRPIFWANRPKSYVQRTEGWDEFPNGRWGDSSSAAFGELSDSHFFGFQGLKNPEDRKAEWGEAPLEDKDVWEIFARYVEGRCSRLPWCAEPLQLETVSIIEKLSLINRSGFLTINSQPQLNGVDSEDPVFGWGGSGGVVYQKAYLEFFTSTSNFKKLKNLIELSGSSLKLTYHATNHDGSVTFSNSKHNGTAAVTWGVFPGREVLQPTVVDPEAFMVWKDEAFSLWLEQWASIYDDESLSYELMHQIHDTYMLVNVVDNNFQNGDLFAIFDNLVDDNIRKSNSSSKSSGGERISSGANKRKKKKKKNERSKSTPANSEAPSF